jgi:hypothetical protein
MVHRVGGFQGVGTGHVPLSPPIKPLPSFTLEVRKSKQVPKGVGGVGVRMKGDRAHGVDE